MLMLIMRNMTINNMYILQEMHAFVFNEIAFSEITLNEIAFKVLL